MAGAAVTFLSFTLAHVILRLRVAREIIGYLSVTDTYILGAVDLFVVPLPFYTS